MAYGGTFSIDGASTVWETRITIGGILVDGDWSIDRSAKNMPGMTSGQTGARGSITNVRIVKDDGMVIGRPTPWNRMVNWPPRPGTPVTIDVRANHSGWWRRFDGIVDKVEGSVFKGMDIEITDRADRFKRPVNLPPLMSIMPPIEGGGAYRYIGLHMSYFVERALRMATYTSTTSLGENVTFEAGLSGSLWPGRGTVESTSQSLPGMRSARWGVGMYGFTATFKPIAWDAVDVRPYCVMEHAIDDTPMTGYRSIDFTFSGGGMVRLQVGPNNSVYVTSGSQVIANIPGGTVVDRVALERDGTGVNVAYRNKTTGKAVRTPVVQVTGSGGKVTDISINASDTYTTAGGILVYYPNGKLTDWDIEFRSNARIVSGLSSTTMTASRAVNLQCASLLDAVCGASLSHWGLTEDNKAIVYPAEDMLYGNADFFLTDDLDIYDDVNWVSDIQSIPRGVKVKYRKAQAKVAKLPVYTVWEGTGATLQLGETDEQFIHPEENVEWYKVDSSYDYLQKGAAVVDRVRQGVGNIFSATYQTKSPDGTDVDVTASTAQVNVSLTKLDDRSWKATHKSNTTAQLTLQVEPTAAWVPKSVAGQKTPLIRASGMSTWLDAVYEEYRTNELLSLWEADQSIWACDANDRPVMEFDLGDWGTEAGAKQVANTMLSWAGELAIILDDLDIKPEPRLQLMDFAEVLIERYDLKITGGICKIRESFTSSNGYGQSISCMVGQHENLTSTWDELEAANSTRTWGTFETARSGDTWSDVESNPLD